MARLVLIIFLTAAACAQDIAARVDEYVAATARIRPFSGSILLSKDNKILFAKGYGMANLEHSVPNTPRTKFRLGSITKQFAATAILQLEERGKLKVEDAICQYVPECPDSWKPITIHHLLTHTSGIRNVTALPSYRRDMMLPSPPLQTMKRFRDLPLDFDPGTKFSYSNSGYVVLAIIVEKASGESWDAFLRKNIFDPAGMHDSGHDTFAAVLPHRASGYELAAGKWIHSPYHDMEMPTGGGDLYSTVEDMYRWDLALQGEKILSAASKQKMYTPFKDNYAYGWAVDQQSGRKRIGHNGGISGFVTAFARFPDERAVVVILSNFTGSPMAPLTRAMTAILFDEKYQLPSERTEIKVDPKIYDAYVGKYELRPGFVLTVTREGDRLMTQATGQGKVEVFPESETKFFLKVIDAQVTFHRGADGKVGSLTLHQGGDRVAKRIE